MVGPRRLRLPHRQPGPRRQQPVQHAVERRHDGRPRAQPRPPDRHRPPRLPRQRVRASPRVPPARQVRAVPPQAPRLALRLSTVHRREPRPIGQRRRPERVVFQARRQVSPGHGGRVPRPAREVLANFGRADSERSEARETVRAHLRDVVIRNPQFHVRETQESM